MPNRLANEASPYLLQHRENPIDWYAWGAEAFERAKSDDKPIFLSIGYSSCHWCHVMAHESFEDDAVAKVLNERFVSIKVDREELPDVDEAYMMAVQLATGRGGWPMTVFVTPELKPFFAGTYFPKDDRGQYPGFSTLIRSVSHAWAERREELLKSSNEFAAGLSEQLTQRPPPMTVDDPGKLFELVMEQLHETFDMENGGFGGAPKFPPHTALSFMLRYAVSSHGEQAWRDQAAEMALITLEKMALGGIHDHVGGGFHRYSTDERWHLPHFEKMLSDNALILENYSRALRLIGDMPDSLLRFGKDWRAEFPRLEKLFDRAARGTGNWIGWMTTPEGVVASALDADSGGAEGAFYMWTTEELQENLKTSAIEFEQAFQCLPEGNFLDEATHKLTGKNVLHCRPEDAGKFDMELALLLKPVQHRLPPMQDHKALANWNGMAICGLIECGESDIACAIALMWIDRGSLPHMIVHGAPSGEPYLDDIAHMATALHLLSKQEIKPSLKEKFMEEANQLTDQMVADFAAPGGGFNFTSPKHQTLFGRTIPCIDGATPSANAAAIRCLIHAGRNEESERHLRAVSGWIERVPAATEALAKCWLLLGQVE